MIGARHDQDAERQAHDVVRLDLRQGAVEGLSVVPGLPLDQPHDGQHDAEPGDADQHQPVLQVRQKPAVQRLAGDARQDEIQAPQRRHPGEPQNADVGVRHHPVVEVGDALHIRQGHHRALDVDEEVVDGPGEDELGADVGVDVAELALDRVPDVDQEDHDRDHHGDAVDDGDGLQPGGHRHLQQVVGPDVGVDDDERPEAEQRQGVAVKRAAGGDGQHVVGHPERHRRQQQAEDVVAVEPQQDGIRDARQRAACPASRSRCRGSRCRR